MIKPTHILTFVAATVLAIPVLAQMQPPGAGGQVPPGVGGGGQTPPDTRGVPPTGVPQGDNPPNPGAVPQAQMADPYAADKDFVRSVAESSATEIHLGKIAQEKASSDAVKELAAHMVEAHTQTTQQLKQAAAQLKVPLPADPPKKAKKAEDKLSKLSGADFDRAYAKMAADEQKQTVKEFERESKNGKIPEMKSFAGKNLSAEQEREKSADELARGGTGSASRQK